MVILGIDPGFATIGYGVIEKHPNNRLTPVDYGIISTPKEKPFPERLVMIKEGIDALVEKFRPDAVAVEELFFNTNITTGINVAHARGVILLAVQLAEIPLYEYTPLQAKLTLTGNGRAEKAQVQFMTQCLLKLSKPPRPDDAADALAIAITHANTNQRLTASTRIAASVYKKK